MSASAYVSSQFPMHPLEVREVVAEWHQSLPPAPVSRRLVRAEPRLWLAAQPAEASADFRELYAVPGVLWLCGRPVRLRAEFRVWSSTVSEVGIRPAHLSWPVGTERYGRRALTVIDDVIRSLQAFAAQRAVNPAMAPVDSRGADSRGAEAWWPRLSNPRPVRSVVPSAS